MTELRVLDVGTGLTPLVGPYSRFGWNHPGPLLFWLLAVPYRLARGSSSALLLAAAMINAASVAGMLGFAWRRGRLSLVGILALVLAVCTHTLGPVLLRNPWNAWITVLPFGLLLLAAWSALEGDRLGLYALAVVGAFLSQSHVGFVPLTVVLTVAGVVGFVRRAPGWRQRAVTVAGALLVLCWLPVLIGTVSGDGNALKVAQHFAGGGNGDAPAGLSEAAGVAALELGIWPPWLTGPEPVNAIGGGVLASPVIELLLPLALLAAATAVTWRRRAEMPQALSFLGVVALAAVTGLLAVSRISGGVYDYLIRWWWPLAAIIWAAVLWPLGLALADRLGTWSAPRRVLEPLAPVVLAAACLAVVGGFALDTGRSASAAVLPVEDWGPSMATLAPTVGSVSHERPVLLRNVGPLAGWASDAYALQLARGGVDVRVDDSGINRYKFGAPRLWDGRADLPVIWVVTGAWIGDFEQAGIGRLLVRYDPLSPARRADYREREHRLRLAFRAAGRDDLEGALDEGTGLSDAASVSGVDLEDLRTVEEARWLGVPVAVFEVADPSVSLPDHAP